MTQLILPISGRDHVQGPTDALVTLVAYGSYECSQCAQIQTVVEQLQQRMGGRLCFVFRHFPSVLPHSSSLSAAEAAEAAAAQGKFWAMHQLLFEHSQALEEANLRLFAATLGLDIPRFLSEMAQHVYAERVRQDFESGLQSGVSSTPTFFINGVRHDDDWDADTLLAAMERGVAKIKYRVIVFSNQAHLSNRATQVCRNFLSKNYELWVQSRLAHPFKRFARTTPTALVGK